MHTFKEAIQRRGYFNFTNNSGKDFSILKDFQSLLKCKHETILVVLIMRYIKRLCNFII